MDEEVLPGIKQRINENIMNDNKQHTDEEVIPRININNTDNTFFYHKAQHKYTFKNMRG